MGVLDGLSPVSKLPCNEGASNEMEALISGADTEVRPLSNSRPFLLSPWNSSQKRNRRDSVLSTIPHGTALRFGASPGGTPR